MDPMTIMAILAGVNTAMSGAQMGLGMTKGTPPGLPQTMPVTGRSFPTTIGNPYENPMPLGMDPYNKVMQGQNGIQPGLSSALRRYGGNRYV